MASLLLASASPRRKELLAAAGYRFEVVTAAVEEVAPPYLTVREMVLRNAQLKGAAVAALRPESCVIAADTLVAHEGQALGKPRDLAEARAMLRQLAGRTHQVFSGVWVGCGQGIESFVETSHVRFRALSEREIDEYTHLVHVLDKAGAYAAQEDPIGLIAEITGSRTNVIGLPMERLKEVLNKIMKSSARDLLF